MTTNTPASAVLRAWRGDQTASVCPSSWAVTPLASSRMAARNHTPPAKSPAFTSRLSGQNTARHQAHLLPPDPGHPADRDSPRVDPSEPRRHDHGPERQRVTVGHATELEEGFAGLIAGGRRHDPQDAAVLGDGADAQVRVGPGH